MGGSRRPAPRLGRPDSPASLQSLLADLGGKPFRVLGGGANTLVSDAGVDEPVLILEGEFDRLAVAETELEAGAAAQIPALVNEARRGARAHEPAPPRTTRTCWSRGSSSSVT